MGNEQSSTTGANEAPNISNNDRRSRYEVGESVDHSLKKRATNMSNSEDLTKSPSRRDSSTQREENEKTRRNKRSSAVNMPQLHITTESWKKDSFGLFDFECKELQMQQIRHEGTGKILREQRFENGDKRKTKINIRTLPEPLTTKPSANLGENQTALAKVVCEEEGFWLYHSNKVDLTTMFSLPEEKLWLVVKHYNGVIEQSPGQTIDGKRGIKLEKNSVIKMGRVRLRVRDIDYADEFKPPVKPILTSPERKFGIAMLANATSSSPQKNQSSANKLKGKNAAAGNGDDFDGIIDLNEIKLIEEAQSRAEALAAGRLIDQEIAMAKREAKAEKKKLTKIDADGKRIVITEELDIGGQPDPTKLTEQSEETVCRICWSTEAEDREGGDFDELNPILSPCKCTGTQGSIHLQCLRSWLETKRTRRVHKGQVMLKFNRVDCEICKQVLPFKIAFKNKIVDIVGVEKPQKNFIVLESLTNDEKKVFHIINTEDLIANNNGWSKKKIKIGRGQDSDVRVVDDISVSRNHAFIHRDVNGHYYLTDNNSKFGTLSQLQYPVYLSAKAFANGMAPLAIQAGKTLLHMRVRKAQSCSERYSCLRACMSCFSRKRQQSVTNLITLDGMSQFPKEFLDLKAFNSNKAQAIGDCSESSVDEIQQSQSAQAAGQPRIASQQNAVDDRATRANILVPAGDATEINRLLVADMPDNRLLGTSQQQQQQQQQQPAVSGQVSVQEPGNETPMHMSLMNNSFGQAAAANNGMSGEPDVPNAQHQQLMLQRAMTALPGTHILDIPTDQASMNSFVRGRNNSPQSREEDILQHQREDSQMSHNSSANLVSNMPDPVVPNRSRHSHSEAESAGAQAAALIEQQDTTPIAIQDADDQFTLRANMPSQIGEVIRAPDAMDQTARLRNPFAIQSGAFEQIDQDGGASAAQQHPIMIQPEGGDAHNMHNSMAEVKQPNTVISSGPQNGVFAPSHDRNISNQFRTADPPVTKNENGQASEQQPIVQINESNADDASHVEIVFNSHAMPRAGSSASNPTVQPQQQLQPPAAEAAGVSQEDNESAVAS